ncbi:hypothetical protein [uncultured Tenacibaculum sp.]|uniref:hypothetical protein n=1 Tax=uncultured Tenacibaculum sp. TaxID=174713 RepID=UPI00261FE917|nr:hypothetical protein [uncultured Tenacibaculum sp.]
MKNCIAFIFMFYLLVSCSLKKEEKYVSTGGELKGKLLCPKEINDVIIRFDTIKENIAEPKMTILGVKKFIERNNIKTIEELLKSLPRHLRTNFSLVEHTKGEGQSNLKFPRIVLFGSDGTFLMNISTKPDDPKYDLLDCAELIESTGKWEFSQFDFQKETPILHRNPNSCIRCHGDQPRPVWGTNMNWPGVFGDNEAAGLNGEALSYRHALRMEEIKSGNSYNKRFDYLIWSDQKLTSGGIRRIADNAFGAELLVSNMAIGTATARGVFTRMKNENQYKELREIILLLGYEHMIKGLLSDSNKKQIQEILLQYNITSLSLDTVFSRLNINTEESFSLETLAKEEEPKTNWSLGAGDLYDQVLLQVLYDLYQEDTNVEMVLKSILADENSIFGCDNLATTMKDVVDFKMLHMHQLLGKKRYEVNKVYYPQDVENIKEKVFIPIYDKLVSYLKKKLKLNEI